MCLGIPMRVRRINNDFAEVESGRLLRKVNIQMLPDLKPGDYILVHAGFAIQKVDPQKAKETLKLAQDLPMEDFFKRAAL